MNPKIKFVSDNCEAEYVGHPATVETIKNKAGNSYQKHGIDKETYVYRYTKTNEPTNIGKEFPMKIEMYNRLKGHKLLIEL